MNWYIEVLKKYIVFRGRARRKEYWMFVLFSMIISFSIGIIEGITGVIGLGLIYGLAILTPSTAVAVRRLHDTNRSGWWLLISLVPLIGIIILLVFMVQDGQAEENQYGIDPKSDLAGEQH
ncbi:DUF805 domain-containing protein [Elusimicrobiota bacterium]